MAVAGRLPSLVTGEGSAVHLCGERREGPRRNANDDVDESEERPVCCSVPDSYIVSGGLHQSDGATRRKCKRERSNETAPSILPTCLQIATTSRVSVGVVVVFSFSAQGYSTRSLTVGYPLSRSPSHPGHCYT
jgi:hypothetical protein